MRTKPLVLAAVLSTCAMGASAAQAAPAVGFTGDAYGTAANVGNVVVLGKTAPVGLGCLTPPNTSISNTLATVAVPSVLTVGTINTSASTSEDSSSASDTTSAEIAGADVLNGAIKASAIKAVSTTTDGASGIQTNADGSHLLGLWVNGTPILLPPGPNTTIPLPGIGKVVLNEQQRTSDATGVSFTVNAIDVYVSATDIPGVSPGTQIIVGHASSGLALPSGNPSATLIRGIAYSTSVNVGGLITSGPQWPIGLGLGCGGVNGGVATNQAAGVNVWPVLSSGTLLNTAQGSLDSTGATGETTATIQNVDLLNGLIKAKALTADATAAISPTGSVTFSDGDSKLVGLVVGGQKIPIDTAPNTKIDLGALKVWIHRVVRTSHSISVRMLEVTGVPPANDDAGDGGIDIRVAVAETST